MHDPRISCIIIVVSALSCICLKFGNFLRISSDYVGEYMLVHEDIVASLHGVCRGYLTGSSIYKEVTSATLSECHRNLSPILHLQASDCSTSAAVT